MAHNLYSLDWIDRLWGRAGPIFGAQPIFILIITESLSWGQLLLGGWIDRVPSTVVNRSSIATGAIIASPTDSNHSGDMVVVLSSPVDDDGHHSCPSFQPEDIYPSWNWGEIAEMHRHQSSSIFVEPEGASLRCAEDAGGILSAPADSSIAISSYFQESFEGGNQGSTMTSSMHLEALSQCVENATSGMLATGSASSSSDHYQMNR